jgi:uncharacterized cupin superfamily protein
MPRQSKKFNYRAQFSEIAQSKGYKTTKASRIENEHNIDLTLEGQIKGKPTTVSVDIKKKNGKHSNSWVYIEYVNSKGKEGWLYGWAEFVVFETGNSFIFVSRKALLKFLNESSIVRWDLPFVDQAWKSKYRLFRRHGTLEKITQIEISHLLSFPSTAVWKKL